MRVFHSDQYEVPLPPGHRFPMEKYRLLRERLLDRSTLPPDWLHPSEPLGREDLARAHPALPRGPLVRHPHPGRGAPVGLSLVRSAPTPEGLRERDRRVLEAAWRRSLPVVLTLGGGYCRPLDATLDAHVGTYAVALAVCR